MSKLICFIDPDPLIESKFGVTVDNTNHDLDSPFNYYKKYSNFFMFEIF